MRAQINDLLRMEEALKKLTASCSGRGPVNGCPIIEALNVPDGTQEE